MRYQRTLLCLLMLGGLAVRIALMVHSPGDLTTDSDGYLAHAKPLAQGKGFLGPSSLQSTAFRPPAYPMALAFFTRIGVSDAFGVASINLFASVLIVVLTWRLAILSKLPAAWSMLATAIVALDPLLLRYVTFPMTEVPCSALLLAAVVCFRYGDDQRRQGKLSWWWISAGFMFGLGALMRPVVMISCAFVSLAAVARQLFSAKTDVSQSVSRGVMMAMLPGVIAGITLTPWIVRNAIQFHRFIPATTHGGYTLALGNNSDFYRDVVNTHDKRPWDGVALDAWQQRMIAAAEADGIRPGDEPSTDAWYYQQASKAIREDRGSFFRACLLRLRRFCAISPAGDSTSRIASVLISVWYGFLWLGLAFQLLASWCRRKTEEDQGLADLWLVVQSFMLMHAVYWTDTRMRAPLMPILCVLSIVGWKVAASVQTGRRTVK